TDNKANVPTLAIGALAVDWSTTPETIYAGTGEYNHCQDCLPSQGVLISKDAGNTWSLNGQSTFTAGAFYFSSLSLYQVPLQANPTILAGTNRGLYESTDGGTTWTAVTLTGLTRVDSLVQDPTTPA